MLNISDNSVNKYVDRNEYDSLREVEKKSSGKTLIRILTGVSIILVLVFFLPWTQNIRSKGKVTTFKPDQRPQTVQTVIPGRIEKWFVTEGDFVNRGDTIMHISEVKDDYFDPELVTRTEEQLAIKEASSTSYANKVSSLEKQIVAMKTTQKLKYNQAENKLQISLFKVTSDSMDYEAAKLNFEIAERQFKRFENLEKQGLKSKTELENRSLTYQKNQAEMIAKQNKLLASRNEVVNARVELNSINAQFLDKITKAEADKYTALSDQLKVDAEVTKLKNQVANYSIRQGLYYVLAPQNGYITQAIKSGIGETIKEGSEIVSIMPAEYQLAIEMYVDPIDLPLLKKGQHVRIQFDGWPAIVFSGWPNTSYGTYGGEIFAIDNFISANGKYRIMVKQEEGDEPWPDALRIGAGTNSMIMLKEVPVWFEIWRKINGFPPNYYETDQTTAIASK